MMWCWGATRVNALVRAEGCTLQPAFPQCGVVRGVSPLLRGETPAAWHRQAHHGDENLCLGFRHSDGKKWVPWDVCITSELGREQDFPMVIFFQRQRRCK